MVDGIPTYGEPNAHITILEYFKGWWLSISVVGDDTAAIHPVRSLRRRSLRYGWGHCLRYLVPIHMPLSCCFHPTPRSRAISISQAGCWSLTPEPCEPCEPCDRVVDFKPTVFVCPLGYAGHLYDVDTTSPQLLSRMQGRLWSRTKYKQKTHPGTDRSAIFTTCIPHVPPESQPKRYLITPSLSIRYFSPRKAPSWTTGFSGWPNTTHPASLAWPFPWDFFHKSPNAWGSFQALPSVCSWSGSGVLKQLYRSPRNPVP